MKAYAIRDASISRSRDLAYLLYYENERRFYIELREDVTEWEMPLLLSSFSKRGIYSVDSAWSEKWVSLRIVPRDRQNLGMILKENGLDEYDPHALLVIADGRCAQDDCFIRRLPGKNLPDVLRERLGKKLAEVTRTGDEELLIAFRDGKVYRITVSGLISDPCRRRRLKAYRDGIDRIRMQAGGHAIILSDDEEVLAEELRDAGEEVAIDRAELHAYMRQNLIGTTAAAELMQCTRQNVLDLVRRGKLQPFMKEGSAYLFLRSEIDA